MTTFADIVAYLIGLLNQTVFILAGLAVVVFLWGMVKYILNAAKGKRQDKKTMSWSLVALFVMFSVWGIIRLMCLSFDNICANTTNNAPTNIVPAAGAWNY